MAAECGQRGEVLPWGERGVESGAVHEAGHTVGSVECPLDRCTQDLQATAVGHREPQQKAEQRRLSGAVRSDQAVDLTLRYIEIDAVQGDDITEALRDTASPDCAEFFHGSLSFKYLKDPMD
ncbi:hypothetical protein SSPO_040510 [Streptomyces antimycoticus]|uniref:Uncharacterized protein n=1 Tax=Streptomyces antimycoticus TaxID=68175 RepID=A0A499UIB6_9ACTN|nr:hypothetical protein SSPO_040510 [Streptomyces antimycoticus]